MVVPKQVIERMKQTVGGKHEMISAEINANQSFEKAKEYARRSSTWNPILRIYYKLKSSEYIYDSMEAQLNQERRLYESIIADLLARSLATSTDVELPDAFVRYLERKYREPKDQA